jgi:hypothetical protein
MVPAFAQHLVDALLLDNMVEDIMARQDMQAPESLLFVKPLMSS